MRSAQENLLSEYLEKLISGLQPYENQSREASQKLGLGGISLSRGEAHVLRWVTLLKPVKKAVEIGTLTGLSGLYILDGMLDGGKLWTLEKSEEHGQAAKPILTGFAEANKKQVEVVMGDARETLEKVRSEGPFDLIFIDGNKAAYGDYLAWAEQNLKKGGMLVADNVLLGGSIYSEAKSNFSEKQIGVVKKFNERLMDTSIWRGALIPTGEGLFVAEKV